MKVERVDHCQVPVDGDATKQTRANVEAVVHDQIHHAAEMIRYAPLLGHSNPNGERNRVEQVRDRQADQVDGHAVPSQHQLPGYVQRQAVGWEAHHKE